MQYTVQLCPVARIVDANGNLSLTSRRRDDGEGTSVLGNTVRQWSLLSVGGWELDAVRYRPTRNCVLSVLHQIFCVKISVQFLQDFKLFESRDLSTRTFNENFLEISSLRRPFEQGLPPADGSVIPPLGGVARSQRKKPADMEARSVALSDRPQGPWHSAQTHPRTAPSCGPLRSATGAQQTCQCRFGVAIPGPP